jgi:monofunctional biosynthetic peptidoglycan transglycosylase
LEHHGFDWQAMQEAVEDRLERKSKRGGSTLTQQVAKNLFLWPERSFIRKGLEAYFTALIEAFWSKARIIEVHLNIAEYGDGIYGAEMGSRSAFGKPASALTAEEAAKMVVVLPAPKLRRPSSLSPKMEDRVRWVMDQVAHLAPEYFAGL